MFMMNKKSREYQKKALWNISELAIYKETSKLSVKNGGETVLKNMFLFHSLTKQYIEIKKKSLFTRKLV